MLISIIYRQDDESLLPKWILAHQIIRMVQFIVKFLKVQGLLVLIEKCEALGLQGFYQGPLLPLVPKLRIIREHEPREEIVEDLSVNKLVIVEVVEALLKDSLWEVLSNLNRRLSDCYFLYNIELTIEVVLRYNALFLNLAKQEGGDVSILLHSLHPSHILILLHC